MRPLYLRAPWALPIDAAPIPDAALLIGGDGRIAAVGPVASVPVPDNAQSLHLTDSVLLPGLVNAHTHLELTGFGERAPEREFREWILTIRRLKQARSPEEFLAAARRGLQECWDRGVTTIAETGDSGAVVEALAEAGGSGIVYHEVFGPHPDQFEESLAGLQQRIRELRARATGRVRLGVSPHAPYTVSGPLYSGVAAWAAAEQLPIAVHIAESPAELEFVTRHTGPFADGWTARGIPLLDDARHQASGHQPSGFLPLSPVRWLDLHGVLGPRTLCIHAVQLDQSDIRLLAERQVAIAHCPLSNARHGHGKAPLGPLLRAGLRVGVGTDSVASVGRLDLLAEARAARALADLSAGEALALCTLEGARAIGLEAEIGSLTPRKWGDVIAVRRGSAPPGGDHASDDPAEFVLGSGSEDVALTVLAGRVVHRAPGQDGAPA
jgi:5-methylthioadenosine/S-adenosylhomocysteine deaminase